MIVRKEESKTKKYSGLPADFSNLMKECIQSLEEAKLWSEKNLEVSGRIYPEELIVKFSLKEPGMIRCENFSASLDFDGEAKNLVEKAQVAMEALSSMMEQYYASTEEMDLPEDWHSYKFDKEEIFLMYSTENDDLEAQANALLGDEFSETKEEEVDPEYMGLDIFKEAEERFKNNIH